MSKFPKRIQRKRTRGWRMPKGAVYVGNPTIFGNPFQWRIFGRKKAVSLYRKYIEGRTGELEKAGVSMFAVMALQIARHQLLARLPELRGKDLACWCGQGPCHADVLLRLANKEVGHG